MKKISEFKLLLEKEELSRIQGGSGSPTDQKSMRYYWTSLGNGCYQQDSSVYDTCNDSLVV